MTDIVNNDLQKQKAAGVKTALSRRDFLKFTAVGLGALMFNPFRKKEREEGRWQMPVKFRFGDHNLHTEDVNPDRYALILGETRLDDMWCWRNVQEEPVPEGNKIVANVNRVVNTVKNFGFGSSMDDKINHDRLLGASRRLGIQVAMTDGLFDKSIEDGKRSELFDQEQAVSATRNIMLGEAVALGSVPLFINTLALAAKKLNILDKNNKNPKTYVGNLEKITLDNAKAETFFLWFMLSNSQKIETFLQKLTDTRPNTELGEIIIQRRNVSMAYGCRLIESVLTQNPDLREKSGFVDDKEALIFAGIFHAGLEPKYNTGAQKLNLEMNKLARDSVDFGFWFLKSLTDNPDPNTSEEDALDFFVNATQEYSIPVMTSFCSDEYINAESMQIPDSGRLILWGKLINAYSNASVEDKPIYEKLAKRLLKEDLVFFSPGERANYPEKQAMFDRMNQLKFNGQVEEGIDLSLFSDETNPEGSRQILYISEGVPFFVNQMPDGSVV